ncbi:MAG: putative preprotein translocase SecA subunit [Chloroflexota bacterium]
MLKNFVKLFSGDPTKKTVDQYRPLVEQVNALESQFAALSDEELRAKTEEFKARVAQAIAGMDDEAAKRKAEQDALNELMPETFAAVREASKRTIGLRHYDVQIIGGAALHGGSIAEMRTGEGKTLVATMPVYLNSLTGRGVHLITVNDYLARRDARWMAPIYQALGLSVGVLQMAAMTENGKKAFIVDFERESPQEDQRHLRMVDRVEAYRADVTFGTNSEFGFDYLRDNMAMRLENRVQRGYYFAMVDEVDNVLIDEARTPLIISGPASGDLEWYGRMAQIVKQLKPEDYEMEEKSRSINLTEIGMSRVESLLGIQLLDPNRPEEPNPEQARLLGYLQQALRAQFLFQRNKDYLVQAGKVVIVDESTGRLMPGRRWSDGLHQAVEAKEGVKVEPESVTYATVTLQNYYRMYQKLAGMTGTALTEAEEFNKIYKLEVAPISPNLEYQSYGKEAPLTEIKAKDEDGYAYSYFAKAGDTAPLFFRRKDYPDVIYRTVEAKLRAIVQEIVRFNALGRPLLVGTTSVESSERLSNRLKAEPVRRLMQYMLVRDHYIRANNLEEDGRLIADLVPFNEPIDRITPDALRAFIKPHGMANISLDDDANLNTLLELLRLPENTKERLKKIFQGGVVHQVLNARRHTEESQIIAGAGAFGAVTIATNMAGRGVDIKLGGELAEEVISAVNRVLGKAGFKDPFDMTHEERREALKKTDPANFGLYEAEVKNFLGYFDDMERVKELGGLHVIGSERHEARRIDNQLRGRAARQGDPGSSRFYLSLEDDLMRVQGGAQVSALMERLKVDDSLPLEARLVANVIEQSQHRIEGANFDVRKHLLEYDDVLNTQRQQIYEQRNRIFVKEDLSGDVAEMLENEVTKRVEVGLADEEGPWRLLAWLDQVQPAFDSKNGLFSSYGFKLLLNEIKDSDLRSSTLDLVAKSIEAEYAHALRAIETLIEKTGETLETQISEREDTLDAFFQGLRDREDAPKPQKLMEEINGLMRLALRPSNDLLKKLADDPEDAKDDIQEMVASQLTIISATRVIGAIQNRLGEQVQWQNPLPSDWDELADILLFTTRDAFEKKRERLNAQIARDVDVLLQREDVSTDSGKLRLLITLAQGTRTAFDQKTHKQVKQVFTRFAYAFRAAQLLDGRDAESIADDVMNHLEAAEEALRETWGQSEFTRLSQNATKLADFGPAARIAFGEEKLSNALSNLSAEEAAKLSSALGKYVLNEVHRQLLLSAFSELWVEYLTKVEALRVSIGLEAYAQRDPLVQYKRSASEMFQQLLEEVRGLVIGRAFAARPRRVEITPIETTETATAPGETSVQIGESSDARKKKRRRS